MTQSTAFTCALPCFHQTRGRETNDSKILRVALFTLGAAALVLGILSYTGTIQAFNVIGTRGLLLGGVATILIAGAIKRVIENRNEPIGPLQPDPDANTNEDRRIVELREIILESGDNRERENIWDTCREEFPDNTTFCQNAGFRIAREGAAIYPNAYIGSSDGDIQDRINTLRDLIEDRNRIRFAGRTLAYVFRNNPQRYSSLEACFDALYLAYIEKIVEQGILSREAVERNLRAASQLDSPLGESYDCFSERVFEQIINVAREELERYEQMDAL